LSGKSHGPSATFRVMYATRNGGRATCSREGRSRCCSRHLIHADEQGRARGAAPQFADVTERRAARLREALDRGSRGLAGQDEGGFEGATRKEAARSRQKPPSAGVRWAKPPGPRPSDPEAPRATDDGLVRHPSSRAGPGPPTTLVGPGGRPSPAARPPRAVWPPRAPRTARAAHTPLIGRAPRYRAGPRSPSTLVGPEVFSRGKPAPGQARSVKKKKKKKRRGDRPRTGEPGRGGGGPFGLGTDPLAAAIATVRCTAEARWLRRLNARRRLADPFGSRRQNSYLRGTKAALARLAGQGAPLRPAGGQAPGGAGRRARAKVISPPPKQARSKTGQPGSRSWTEAVGIESRRRGVLLSRGRLTRLDFYRHPRAVPAIAGRAAARRLYLEDMRRNPRGRSPIALGPGRIARARRGRYGRRAWIIGGKATAWTPTLEGSRAGHRADFGRGYTDHGRSRCLFYLGWPDILF